MDGDADLGQLLIQLLRVLSPPAGDDSPADAGISSVSASEARALVELLAARGIAQGELARLLGLEKSTVSRLAAGLEGKGWIRRGRDDGNQRYVRLYLTPEGTAIAARLLDGWQSRQARIMASLTDEERAGLATGLGGLLRGLIAEGILGGSRADGSLRGQFQDRWGLCAHLRDKTPHRSWTTRGRGPGQLTAQTSPAAP